MLQWFKNFLQTSPLPHSNTVQGYFLPTAPEKQQMEHFWWLRNPVDVMCICCECLTVAYSSAKLDKANLSWPVWFFPIHWEHRKKTQTYPPVRILFVKSICNRLSFCTWQKWAQLPQDFKRSNILGKRLMLKSWTCGKRRPLCGKVPFG